MTSNVAQRYRLVSKRNFSIRNTSMFVHSRCIVCQYALKNGMTEVEGRM
jgi:hypothetical protein